jgi:hypothetical protein
VALMSWFLRPDKWPLTPGDWLRAMDDLARAPTRVLMETLASVADALVGKEVELTSDTGTVTVVVESVVGTHSAPPIALGAWRPGLDLEGFERVEVDLSDVRWESGRIDRLHLDVNNVNLEGGVVSKVVAGPIELSGEVDQATVDELLRRYDSPVEVTLDDTDRATVRRGRWVSAVVSAELDGDIVRFPVHQVRFAGIAVPRRFVDRFVDTQTLAVPPLPHGLRATGLSLRPGVVLGTAVLDDFREPMVLESILRAASTVGSHVVLNRGAALR